MAVTYVCPKCRRSLTVYVGKTIPVCTRCGKRMEHKTRRGKQ
jgi:ribosomal protein L37AE/L43A